MTCLVEQRGRLKGRKEKERKEDKFISVYHRRQHHSASTYNPHIPHTRLTPDLASFYDAIPWIRFTLFLFFPTTFFPFFF